MAADFGTVRIQNRTAHIKHISLGGGRESVAVPPTEDGHPGVEVRFTSESEREAFARALQSDAVRGWIDAGELSVGDLQRAAAPSAPQHAPAKPPAHSTKRGASKDDDE